MKMLEKVIRILILIFIKGLFIILLLISGFELFLYGFIPRRITTDYGDSFIIKAYFFGDSYLENNNSDLILPVEYLEIEDIQLVCDTDIFRCYHIENEFENFYLGKEKNNINSTFFWIPPEEIENYLE